MGTIYESTPPVVFFLFLGNIFKEHWLATQEQASNSWKHWPITADSSRLSTCADLWNPLKYFLITSSLLPCIGNVKEVAEYARERVQDFGTKQFFLYTSAVFHSSFKLRHKRVLQGWLLIFCIVIRNALHHANLCFYLTNERSWKIIILKSLTSPLNRNVLFWDSQRY